ncbi:unnamed protein product [Linum tenue]|uniref:PX domain-containing protein n=1 Tax=Linum tenue TaxID=586396 RepID=A0AAV0IM44_9ROSI|nr:unnamed protein product [Linum tenue]
MTNGEVPGGGCVPLGTTGSHDPLNLSPAKSEAGDLSPGSLSEYSSCGESEFERYCSANSVMGTPSMCSSLGPANDYLESEFGSLRSLENFSLGGGIDRDVEGRKLSDSGVDCLKRGAVDVGDDSRGVGFHGGGRVLGETSGLTGKVEGWQDGVHEGNGEAGSDDALGKMVSEGNDGFLSGLESEMHLKSYKENVGLEGEGNGDSDDEDDSMYGCGSDDENRKNLYVQGKVQYSKDVTVDSENPLLINSSVAFGSDDWDDFEPEIAGGNLASLTLDEFQERHGQELGAQRMFLSSMPMTGAAVAGPTEVGGLVTEALTCSKRIAGFGSDEDIGGCSLAPICLQKSEPEQLEGVRDISVASCQLKVTDGLSKDHRSSSSVASDLSSICGLDQEDVRDHSLSYKNGVTNVTAELFKDSSISDLHELELDPLDGKVFAGLQSENLSSDKQMESQYMSRGDIGFMSDHKVSQNLETKSVEVKVDPPLTHHSKYSGTPYFEDHEWTSTHSAVQDNSGETSKVTSDLTVTSDYHRMKIETGNLELNEFYDEIVNEMEEILLDSHESTRPKFLQGNYSFHSQLSLPQRDGGRTASTSGSVDTYSLTKQLQRIHGADVIGAKQKRGDVSFSERLVGVKEYTVYIIRVWSGTDQWEVERRYRDFLTLHRQLKSLSAYQGWSLPLPWSSVWKEPTKLFGSASPDVVSERSALIQECLHSILQPGLFSSPPSALFWFLCPHDSLPSSPASETQVTGSTIWNGGETSGSLASFGKTISLVVEILPQKSMKQLLEAQYDTCAGCHKHFDVGKTLIRDFAQTLGWRKPRVCEYTGRLFCSSCHTNDTAVLPARVLHYWEFTEYPVSQMAKSFLDSIHDQPMLCVSAVNPFLSSKVPVLRHVMSVRKRIGSMLPFLRCPFRRTINKGLGSRRYLLESNDFFALRDLIDLSKGAFAALPVMVETMSSKIREHITEQCLVCCDVGIPCGGRQACDDTSSLIFPFQETEIERCSSCNLVFHRSCFRKLPTCSCGARLGGTDAVILASRSIQPQVHNRSLGRSTSGSTARLLSGLFSRGKAHKASDRKDSDPVIPMGSLPTSALLDNL